MCPTLEQILSRSLMRGKIPLATSSRIVKETNPSAVPSLRVPQAKPAPVHRVGGAAAAAAASSSSSSSPSSASTKKSTAASATSQTQHQPQHQQQHQHQDSVVAAFAGLATPHFSPDPREKIAERPERGGLRSLQDLPSLMQSASALDEWKTALASLKEAIDLVVSHNHHHNSNAAVGGVLGGTPDSSSKNKNRTKNNFSALPVFPIRKLISLDHFVSAANVCRANGADDAFERVMDLKINELRLRSDSDETSCDEKKSAQKLQNAAVVSGFPDELSEIVTEALVESGNWEKALRRYDRLCSEGTQTIGSLNVCISACSARQSLWEVALKLASPAIAAREAEIGQRLVVDLAGGEGNSVSSTSSSSSSVPLSHFGSTSSSFSESKNNSKNINNNSKTVVATAVTYASLVSTLENCGRPLEAARILKAAPAGDREAVMTSYVALLQVWSDVHAKKSMKRF